MMVLTYRLEMGNAVVLLALRRGIMIIVKIIGKADFVMVMVMRYHRHDGHLNTCQHQDQRNQLALAENFHAAKLKNPAIKCNTNSLFFDKLQPRCQIFLYLCKQII